MPAFGRITVKTPEDLATAFTDSRFRQKGNQDRFAFAYSLDRAAGGENWFFAGVCDGVGGEASGELAASVALAEVVADLCAPSRLALDKRLSKAIQRAHTAVQMKLRKSATTFAGVLISESGSFVIGTVGDSRIYSLKGGAAEKISDDDTLIEMLRRQNPNGDDGNLEKAIRALKPELQESLGQAIGSDLPMSPRLSWWGTISEGLGCLLCTDGVWKTAGPVLNEAARASLERNDLSRRLLALTDLLGAHDNATGIVISDIRAVVRWLRDSSKPSERGLVHVITPTDKLTTHREWIATPDSQLGMVAQVDVHAPESEVLTAVPPKVARRTAAARDVKARKKTRGTKPKKTESDVGVQLTIVEEGQDVESPAPGEIPKND